MIPTGDAVAPGRSTVSRRAFEQVARALACELLAVVPSDAKATVTDTAGVLSVDIVGAITTGEEPVLTRAARARDELGPRLSELTGAAVSSVRVRITDIHERKGRVS